MKRALYAATAILALSAPAQSLDLNAMTEDERAAFGEAVRSYLLEHPEVLSEAIDILNQRQAEAEAEMDQDIVAENAEAIFRHPADFVGGNPDGDVTLVEFIDYRCGYCRKAHAEVAELVKSDGNIRYVVKEFPILGEESVLASRFAVAALRVEGAEAYEKINAGFYETFRGDVTSDTLLAFAEELGLDGEKIMAGMDAPEVTQILKDNHALALKLKISGTPAFVTSGQMIRGYVPLDAMRQVVAEERG